MDMQDSKQHPSPLRVGLQCALVVIGFACVVLGIHYFPEDWLEAMAASKDASDAAFLAMIHSLVVPWWSAFVAVCIHLWVTCVAWKLRVHPMAEKGLLRFFRKTFKDITEASALMLIGLYEYLDGMVGADVFLLLFLLVLIPRCIRFFFHGANLAR